METKFKGTGVAIVSPFHEDGKVNFNSLQKLIEHLIGNKINYIVSMGTTGESVTLSKEEKKEILKFTVEKVQKRVPIVVGIGGNNTAEIVKSIDGSDLNGVDAILSVSPYYNKPTQEGIFQHYKTIATNAPLPIIIYNVPGRTSSNILAATTLRMAHEIDNILGVKEASGDLVQCMEIVRDRPQGFMVISGDDALTLPMIGFGMDGVISVVANAFPREFSDMVQSALNREFKEAQKLHFSLLEIMDLLFAEGNPGGVKAALKIIGICDHEVRQPLVKVSDDLYQKIEEAIQKR